MLPALPLSIHFLIIPLRSGRNFSCPLAAEFQGKPLVLCF